MGKKKNVVKKSALSKKRKQTIIAIASVVAVVTVGLLIYLIANTSNEPPDDLLYDTNGAIYPGITTASEPYAQGETMNDNIVALVNGEPISVDEMEMIMGKFRVHTVSYFNSRFGLDFDADFWETEVDGITPIQFIRDLALEFLVERKAQQIVLRDYGIIYDISHEAFLRALEAENIHRQETVDAGGVVFGVTYFDEISYYEFIFINQVQTLLNEFGDELFPVTFEDIVEFHQRNIDSFRRPDELTVDVILVPFDFEGNAYERIREAEAALEDGADFTSVMKEFNPGGEPIEWNLGHGDRRRFEGAFEQAAWPLSEGDISEVFDWRYGWFIIKCTERIPGEVLGIEGREHSIMVEVRWEMYDVFLEQLIYEANVVINEQIFNSLMMEM